MYQLIRDFPSHLQESLRIADAHIYQLPAREIRNVIISGLGGSGIGGTIVSDLSRKYSPVPVVINKDYQVPAFCSAHTLFIASSYSGSTEETLYALQEAEKAGAHIVCITSGGRLQQIAEEKGYDLLLIPGGSPPRAALGYSLIQLCRIFVHFSLLPAEITEQLNTGASWLQGISAAMENDALAIAKKMSGKLPVIYADASSEGVAVRFRQQLNENAKMLAWHHVVPEMNHNELVGWKSPTEDIVVVYLENAHDYPRNTKRMEINREIIGEKARDIIRITSQGNNPVERMLYIIHFCDWISYHLSQLRDVDIMEIEVIDFLKNSLARFD